MDPTWSFVIGEWTVRQDLNQVSNPSVSFRIEPKYMDLLVLLASNPGFVFSRRTLLDTVWHDTAVSEEVLTRAISTLRHLLGDDPRNPSYIETIRKRGYRLIADVRQIDSTGGVSSSPSPKKHVRSPGQIAATVLLMAAGAVLLQTTPGDRSPHDPHATDDTSATVIVLPMKPIGPAGYEYVADGLTEEIVSRLGEISGLRVKSHGAAGALREAGKARRDLAGESEIDYAVSGAVRWYKRESTERLRATARLISVADDSCLWSETFDRANDDIIAVQSEVAKRVVGALVALLQCNSTPGECKWRSSDPVAQRIYADALSLLDRPSSCNSIDLITSLLDASLQLDSTFVAAHLLMSRTYANAALSAPVTDPDQLRRWRRAAAAAKRFSGNSVEGHLAMGYYHYYGERDFDRALSEFAAANEKSPGRTAALLALGLIHRRKGNWEEARLNLQAASESDPSNCHARYLFVRTLLLMRQYGEARRYIEEELSRAPDDELFHRLNVELCMLDPPYPGACKQLLDEIVRRYVTAEKTYDVWRAYFSIGELDGVLAYNRNPEDMSAPYNHYKCADYYLTMGQVLDLQTGLSRRDDLATAYYDSARVLLNHYVADQPEDPWIHTRLGYAYAGLRQKEQAVYHARRATELVPVARDHLSGPLLAFNSAVVHALVGDTDTARKELELVLSVPSSYNLHYVHNYPLLASIDGHRHLPQPRATDP